MGGKNPVVVLEDADLDLAVESAAQGAFGSSGQRCTATSRAVVVNDIADEFVSRIVKRAESMRIGAGNDPQTEMGPSVDENQFKTVLDYIETGMTHINSPTTGGEAHIPFGGIKATGIGDREQGSTALDFYTDLKVVYVDYTGRKREGNLY